MSFWRAEYLDSTTILCIARADIFAFEIVGTVRRTKRRVAKLAEETPDGQRLAGRHRQAA